MTKHNHQKPDIPTLIANFPRPTKAVVTAGMPYANGPLHLGHLAGAHIPADIYARWLGMVIGRENVLFVCGTDDHGSTSELSALKAGKPVRDMIKDIHDTQKRTLDRYEIGLDVYSGTSDPLCFPHHSQLAQDFLRKLFKNGMLEKRVTKQWFDPNLNRFLQDRFVRGKCPNPKCDNEEAYSDECDRCGFQYGPTELLNPKSAIDGTTPELRDTAHWWLDMWKVVEPLRLWIEPKKDLWRTQVYNEVINTILPAARFSSEHEPLYKELKSTLPSHKSRYAPGKKVVLQFGSKKDLEVGQDLLNKAGITTELANSWAHRAITRDVAWGIPVPSELDADLKGKTLYVWPDSLIAPISFSKVALKLKGRSEEDYKEFWCDPKAKIYQFLGQDNVFFYTVMQGAMWLGTQKDPQALPHQGDLQMTDVFGCNLLQVDGEKMSKSRGNFYTGDQLLDEKGYSPDQVRYFLALLGLPEKPSNFDFKALDERNKFLAGPLNAAFEKPISACHSKFEGKVPDGTLNEKVEVETQRIIQKYLKAMDRAEYTSLLFAIENYARLINSMFTQFKPHDDRHPELERKMALYSSFYVLKNIMIMLYPFVPDTMVKLCHSLNLDVNVFTLDELGTPIAAGHTIGEKAQYFPAISSESP